MVKVRRWPTIGVGNRIVMEQPVRWSVKVSRETDLAVRNLLGSEGVKRGGLARFIEDAVRRQVLQSAIHDIRTRNAATDPDEISRIVNEAVSEVRAERRARRG